MTVADMALMLAGMGVVAGIFTTIMISLAGKMETELKAYGARIDATTKRLDDHVVAINQRVDALQAAMMELLAERRK